jgi:ArsR family transcriptional regulator
MDPVAIFKALGQPSRYALFTDLLRANGTSCCAEVDPDESACCVIDFTQRYRLAQSTISHHLQVLVDAQLVQAERRGTYQVYQVNQETWRAFQRHVTALTPCADSDQRTAIGRLLQP